MPAKKVLERATSYSVAWIAALAHERAAALVLLDERHDRPKDFTKNDSDQNSYSWGRIGDHNVVIASLPAGEYGTVSAADTTSGLRASLPHIRVGLLVGIGAGLTGEQVDSDGKTAIKNEILLGDVVVSIPDGTNGGVVQHDINKAKVEAGNQAYERKGCLNAAPRALRSAISALQAEHEIEESRVEEFLQAFKQNTKTKAKYVFQGSDKDRIRRLLQTNTDDNIRIQPAIHYGTVASGNTLVKSAAERDAILALLKLENVHPLCLEMEAAGLMNSFPCIVIRGVCDYADEYKNDEWQPYAAAVAAAFAKELLTYVDSAEVNKERVLGEVLDNIRHDVRQVKSDTTKVRDMMTASERREVLSWLCSADYAPLYNAYSTTRVPFTGDWLLERSEFKDWLSSNASPVLYCPGSPGAGKTFLATRIIDFLFTLELPPKAAVTYMYCEYSRHSEQSLAHLLSCLLRQLAHAADTVPRSVQDLYTKHGRRNTRPTVPELLGVLRTVLTHEFDLVYVVVDALDECDVKACSALVTHLRAMAKDGNLRFLATSRLIPEINELFCQDIHLRLEADGQDVREYVRTRAAEIQERLLFPDDDFNHIVDTIAPAVRGMFLLARLHMDTLNSKTNAREIGDALLSLPDGYNGAYQAAMTRINNQHEGHRALARRVLMWVVCAKRPLLAAELQHAIAVRRGDEALRTDGLTRVELLIAVCAGLVALRDSSLEEKEGFNTGMIVHLAHYTAQEYFDRTRDEWFPKAELAMSLSCLSYLALKGFETGPCDHDVHFFTRLRQYPFLEYAAVFWGTHAASLQTDGDSHDWDVLQEAVEPFVQFPALCDATVQILSLRGEFPFGAVAHTPRRSTACHVFARFGLRQLCDYCHDIGIDVFALDSERKPPLYYALEACKENNTDLLLSWSPYTEMPKHGILMLWYAIHHQQNQTIDNLLTSTFIDPNTRILSNTPLYWAAISGHARTVQTLVACRDIDVNASNDGGDTALLCAVREYHSDANRDDMVDTILNEHDVVFDRCNADDATPLWCACNSAYARTVRLLVGKGGACPNKSHKSGLTPWLAAAKYGHAAVVEAFLDSSASVLSSRDSCGRSALFYAAENGNIDVLNLLLGQSGADVNASDNSGSTILMAAAVKGQDDILLTLLSKEGVDTDCQDSNGATALWQACRMSSLSTVRILCQHGSVDINIPDSENTTPLMLTVLSMNTDLVAYLLGCEKIDVNIKDVHGRTALWYACERRLWSVALSLAEKMPINLHTYDLKALFPLALIDSTKAFPYFRDWERVDDAESQQRLHRRNKVRNNELHMAAINGHLAITEWRLRTEGLHIDARNDHNETPLILAANAGEITIVKMLLLTGAVDLNAEKYSGYRPLSLAAAKGHLEVVACFLDDTFSVGAFRLNQTSRNLALSCAAQYGQEEVVEYLLERDVFIAFGYCRSEVRSPLKLAAMNGHLTVCQMLAEKMRGCDPGRFHDYATWACERLAADNDVTVDTIIDFIQAVGYIDFAAYCSELDPQQASCVLRLWGIYASCNCCGGSNLAKRWCCLVDQQLICDKCVESGFWCNSVDDLFEVSASWSSDFPRFTGRRRSVDPCIRKKLEYWQGLILCHNCGKDASHGYHCRICIDDHFDICDRCRVAKKQWCYSRGHSLKRNASDVHQKYQSPWKVRRPRIGVNLPTHYLQRRLSARAQHCHICTFRTECGYRCGLCKYIYFVCWDCVKDGRWCDDTAHFLQEYGDDAISYPWRSHEEVRSPRRQSFHGQCRYPCEKPARKRRYSLSDAAKIFSDEPSAATNNAGSGAQSERSILSKDDKQVALWRGASIVRSGRSGGLVATSRTLTMNPVAPKMKSRTDHRWL